MRLRFADFKGEIPRLHPRLLPTPFAQAAINTRLEDGAIGPIREAVQAHSFGVTTRRAVRFNNQWLGWASIDVAAVPGPIAADRLYITGDGVPKVRSGSTTYNLALPGATQRPTTSLIGAAIEPTSPGETVLYAYTFRTSLGEESPPSPVSLPLLWRPGQDVRVEGFATGALNRAITHIRVYRSQTSALGTTDLYFVKELPAGTTLFDHDVTAEPLQEVITTTDFDTPPDGLQGIISMPNGMMAAFAGREVFFCEPYQPHAWPNKYVLRVDHPIVGLVAFGPVLAILTTSTPYIAQGNSPEVMIMEKMEANLPCLTRHGIVDLGYAAAYPSHEGLVLITAQGANVVTRNLFTRDQWRKLAPETFRADQYDGRYLFSHLVVGAATRTVGMIDLSGSQPFYSSSSGQAVSWYAEPGTGRLFLIGAPESSGNVLQWDAPDGNLRLMRWRSRLNVLATNTNFGAMRIDTDAVPAGKPSGGAADMTCRVYASGTLVRTFTDVNKPVRLPSGFLATDWEWEIEGYAPVTGVSMATTIAELAET
jgi:hypothetical protein